MLPQFYNKLANVFLKSGDFVFHATALHTVFSIDSKHKKTFEPVPDHPPPSMDAEDAESLKRSGSVKDKLAPFQKAVEEKQTHEKNSKPEVEKRPATLARISTRRL